MQLIHVRAFIACITIAILTFTSNSNTISVLAWPPLLLRTPNLQPLNSSYQIHAYNALLDMGVSPENLFSIHLYKLTPPLSHSYISLSRKDALFFNEEYLALSSPDEQIWTAYHEAAHYILGHFHHYPWSAVLHLALIIGATEIIAQELTSASSWLPWIIRGTTMGAFLYGEINYLEYRWKTYEQEADMHAARILCKNGKSAIVESHLMLLKNRAHEEQTSSYLPSLDEQIEYISLCLLPYQGELI